MRNDTRTLVQPVSLLLWICLPVGCDFPPGYVGSKGSSAAEDSSGSDTDIPGMTSGKTSSSTGGGGEETYATTGPSLDVGGPAEGTGMSSESTFGGAESGPRLDVGGDPSATEGDDATDTETGGGLPYPACASLIDDLDDGDEWIVETDGRSGDWYVYGDATGTHVPALAADLPTLEGHPFTGYAAVATGRGFTDWGAGVGLNLNLGAAYDAVDYEGVAFLLASSQARIVRFKVTTTSTLAVADGGGCDDTVCNDFYGIDLMAQPGGALHLVPFADLAQEGWGAPTTFEPSQIHDLQWQVGLVPNAYDIAIDAVCFY